MPPLQTDRLPCLARRWLGLATQMVLKPPLNRRGRRERRGKPSVGQVLDHETPPAQRSLNRWPGETIPTSASSAVNSSAVFRLKTTPRLAGVADASACGRARACSPAAHMVDPRPSALSPAVESRLSGQGGMAELTAATDPHRAALPPANRWGSRQIGAGGVGIGADVRVSS